MVTVEKEASVTSPAPAQSDSGAARQITLDILEPAPRRNATPLCRLPPLGRHPLAGERAG